MARALAALGIFHVGARLAEVLAEAMGSVAALKEATVEDLEAIDEVGPEIAKTVYEFFHDERTLGLVEDLQGKIFWEHIQGIIGI